MARQIIDVKVEKEGRDQGKVFRLTEMDAYRAELWGMRALTVMNRANVDLPVEALGAGMIAIALYGFRALMSADFDQVQPLLDEMMECVQRVPSPDTLPEVVRRLVPDDTEEIGTRLWLRERLIELHTGFSLADVISDWKARTSALVTSPPNSQTSPPT